MVKKILFERRAASQGAQFCLEAVQSFPKEKTKLPLWRGVPLEVNKIQTRRQIFLANRARKCLFSIKALIKKILLLSSSSPGPGIFIFY